MLGKFYGKEREKILQRLAGKWLPGSMPVAILQGFPGCGKSQLAREVAEKADRILDPVEPQFESFDPVSDLFLDLAIALEQNGLLRLAQEFDKGEKANFSKALLDTLRYEKILVIIDEFQRIFSKEATHPPAPWRNLVEQLGNSPNPQGRLLLISNRVIKIERWCENCHIEEVKRLADSDAEALFTDLLETSGLSENVPVKRRREIAHRLGGNPRALRTLVGCLRADSLDNLLSVALDPLVPGDVVLDPQLVEDFERELLERALPRMEADLLKFMRWLSVHRRPFRKEALAQFTGGRTKPESLRKQLFERFLLEQTMGGDVPHPLAREISVTRLRASQGEWAQAHNLAANYHFRHFKARQLKGESTLTTSYVELRHHLYEAGRIAELSEADERLTQFALSQITFVTPIPINKELLETRIALLTAISDERRPKVLNYHLARCLMKRRTTGDDKRALKYVRKATGPRIFQGVWVFRLNLEFQLSGLFTAMQVVDEALRYVPTEKGTEQIYLRGAELMAKANRLDDAIKLLEKGIDVVPAGGNLFSLYQSCAELMAKANRLDDAIKLLEKGIDVVPAGGNLFSLYQSCAELMAKANRLDDAIKLLEKGIAVPGMTSLSSLYQSCAELMAKANRLDDAIKLLEKGIDVVPAGGNLFSLYQSCAELMAKANRLDDAIKLLEKGIDVVPAGGNLFSLYQSCAELMAKANRLDDAIKLLEKGIDVVPVDGYRHVLYQRSIQISGVSGDAAKVEALAEKGLSTYPKWNFGRYKISETALSVLAALRDADALYRLQQLVESPQQHALADYLLMRISGDWEKAAAIANKGVADFPDYAPLRINEADARLALGQLKEAVALMVDYQVDAIARQTRDNPVIWFKAYVAGILAGDIDEARNLAAMYAPHDFDSACELDKDELMRLWAIARNWENLPLEMIFPGLLEFSLRNSTPANTEQTPAAPAPIHPCVLAVATEWTSRHGGLSTFNRDLCTALVAAGARVVCYVPQADAEEIDHAKKCDVEIVVAKKIAGAKDVTLLLQRPVLPVGFLPDVVIGHDRITGPASVILVRDHFSNSKRVLFIHTSPEEIEWHKESRDDSTCAGRAEERKREQLSLSEGCSLVIAVGPRLTREFSTDLHGAGIRVPVMEITPGMAKHFDNCVATHPPAIRCLILGRVEDYQLKGLDLAAKALGRVIANWKDNADPPKLVVRGAPIGTDDELRERLNSDSAPTELDIVIRHYSADETEIRNDLREASLVLMPSKKEGFGLVGLEAIASGVPTLISAQSGLAETLRSHAPELANEWILPVTGDAVTKWAERIELRLLGREGAFSRATVLREELSRKLDWSRSATEVLDKLFRPRTV